MKAQIDDAIKAGYRPAIYIDDWLFNTPNNQEELKQIKAQAKQLNVPVVHSKDVARLHAFPKLHVFRYGDIPVMTCAIIVRRKGRIVPGSFITTPEV